MTPNDQLKTLYSELTVDKKGDSLVEVLKSIETAVNILTQARFIEVVKEENADTYELKITPMSQTSYDTYTEKEEWIEPWILFGYHYKTGEIKIIISNNYYQNEEDKSFLEELYHIEKELLKTLTPVKKEIMNEQIKETEDVYIILEFNNVYRKEDILDVQIDELGLHFFITKQDEEKLNEQTNRDIDKIIKEKHDEKRSRAFNRLQNDIIKWGRAKNINDAKSQFLKVVEEFGEIQLAKNKEEFMDAIGDTLVTLIILNDMLQRQIKGHAGFIPLVDMFLENDFYKYVKEKRDIEVTGDIIDYVNTDTIIELSRIAECISKMTDDNKEYHVKKIRLHISKIIKYVIYLAKTGDIDHLESLQLAYDTIANRTGKTIDGVFVKEEDL